MGEKLILFDANIIIPPAVWDLYKRTLEVPKSPGSPHLKENTAIEDSELARAVREVELAQGIISDETRVTRGVVNQALNQINKVSDNIKRRGSDYLFVAFNYCLNRSVRENNERIYASLLDLETKLENLGETAKNMQYKPSYDEYYSAFTTFVRGLHSSFFDVRKADHAPDFGADEELVIGAVYESFINHKSVEVISNDNDIACLLGTCYAVLEKARPLVSKNENFRRFYENKPRLFRMDSYEGGPSEVDTLSKGEYIIRTLSGFGAPGSLSEDEIRQYNNKVTQLVHFINTTISSLTRSED
ncbi:MAG: hypothetical protein R6U32_00900 [Candidatus Woesearchaeota archaeon]